MIVKTLVPNPPLPGHNGFYPCEVGNWQALPLPLRCATSYPINKKHIAAVVFDTWFDNYKIRATVEVHPENVFKALFCFPEGGTQLYSVVRVKWDNGSYSSAKWVQDQQTGAYSIIVGGAYALRQGGFEWHIPANCEYDEIEQKWKMRQVPSSQSKTYSCLV